MTKAGIPVTVRSPDFPGGTAFQPKWETVITPDTYEHARVLAGQEGEDFTLWTAQSGGRILLSNVWLSVTGAGVVHLTRQPYGGGEATAIGAFRFAEAVTICLDAVNGIILDPGDELHWRSGVEASITVILKEV